MYTLLLGMQRSWPSCVDVVIHIDGAVVGSLEVEVVHLDLVVLELVPAAGPGL